MAVKSRSESQAPANTVKTSADDRSTIDTGPLKIENGRLVGRIFDAARPFDPVEIEILGPDGFYRRLLADQAIGENADTMSPPHRSGFSASLPGLLQEAGTSAFRVFVAGTADALRWSGEAPTGGGGTKEHSQPRDRWRLLVHRMYWDLTGNAAPADRLENEATLVEEDPVAGTSALLRRLAARTRPPHPPAPPVPDGNFVMSAEALVTEAYRGALGRDPETDGLGIFGSAVQSGTPLAEVIKALLASAEFKFNWDEAHPPEEPPPPDPDVVTFNIDALVAAAYRSLLGREPEAAAFEIFRPLLRDGAELSALLEALTVSDEFRDVTRREHVQAPPQPASGTFTFTPEELVEVGYRTALKRDPEPAGYEIYGNAIRNGYKFEEFLTELFTTPECLSAWGFMKASETAGRVMVASELSRLSASIERSLLTLAMGAALAPSDAAQPSLENAASRLADGDGRAGVRTGRAKGRAEKVR